MDAGVLQKGIRDSFSSRHLQKMMNKKSEHAKKRKKSWNCSELYLIYFHGLLSTGQGSGGGRTAACFYIWVNLNDIFLSEIWLS